MSAFFAFDNSLIVPDAVKTKNIREINYEIGKQSNMSVGNFLNSPYRPDRIHPSRWKGMIKWLNARQINQEDPYW